VREFVDEWRLDGKRIFVLADGRLINLAPRKAIPRRHGYVVPPSGAGRQ